jgi:phage-related protein
MIRLFDKEFREYPLDDYGVKCLLFNVESLSVDFVSEKISGRDGIVILDNETNERTFQAEFIFTSEEYHKSRNELFRLFNAKKEFYIVDTREPEKRWFVRVSGVFSPEKANFRTGSFPITFISSSPYAESINKAEYKHTSNFSFNNIGDVAIEMVEQTETEIEFVGTSDNLTIRNTTTGDEWQYNGTTTGSDAVLLKGVRSTKNGVSIFGNTNKKLLTFAPGWNDIEIEGATDYSITIRTRFYYI